MSFDSLGLSAALLRAVAEQGYTAPTPIQAQVIPVVLAGRDVLAGAQTGTGKTAGFTLPLLQRLTAAPPASAAAPASAPGSAPAAARAPVAAAATAQRGRPPRALILTPTRELAAQVGESVRAYGRHLPLKSAVIFGGVNINPQTEQLRRGLDVLVATPGRLLDHAQQRHVDLRHVEIFVLDEADRMLDMGFLPDIRRVIALLPPRRQNLLFSATFPDDIRALANKLLHDPASVEIGKRNAAAAQVDQTLYFVDKSRKRDTLSWLIGRNDWPQVLVFTRTKHGANRLAQQLEQDGLPAAAIHGNKSQGARTRALADFKSGAVRVLVATDIAARGIDIDELPHVVNFELPEVPEYYVHRIGRTGRAGHSGSAVSLVAPDERPLLKQIERLLGRSLAVGTLDGIPPTAQRAAGAERSRDRQRARDGQRPREAQHAAGSQRPAGAQYPPGSQRPPQAHRSPSDGRRERDSRDGERASRAEHRGGQRGHGEQRAPARGAAGEQHGHRRSRSQAARRRRAAGAPRAR